METRFLNCPFCAGEARIGVSYAWGGQYAKCKKCGVCAALDDWNRRTPDLTEALARLKALEEWMRDHRARMLPEFTIIDKWADEIAAIRKVLGADD